MANVLLRGRDPLQHADWFHRGRGRQKYPGKKIYFQSTESRPLRYFKINEGNREFRRKNKERMNVINLAYKLGKSPNKGEHFTNFYFPLEVLGHNFAMWNP